MKSTVKVTSYALIAVSLIFQADYTLAAKPPDVIELSNGHPNGPHLNLNLHGNETRKCDSAEGGNPVFILENGDSTIGYVPNRKSSNNEITVIGKCNEDFDDNSASMQIPCKSETTDITDLFMWTGWVFNAILDTSGDGIIDESDVPLTYDSKKNGGNGDGVIGDIEFKNWLSDSEYVGLAKYYENEWILNIAYIVFTEQAIINDDTKLLKVHFYPAETTVYE